MINYPFRCAFLFYNDTHFLTSTYFYFDLLQPTHYCNPFFFGGKRIVPLVNFKKNVLEVGFYSSLFSHFFLYKFLFVPLLFSHRQHQGMQCVNFSYSGDSKKLQVYGLLHTLKGRIILKVFLFLFLFLNR